MNKLLIVVCVFLLQNISATEIAKNQLSENSHYSVQISSIKDRSAHISATMTLAKNKIRMAAWGHPSLQHGWATFVTNLVVTDSKGNNITVTPIDDKGWGSWHVDANNGQTIHLEYDVSFSHDQHDWNPAGGQDSRPAVTNDALFLVTKALFIYSPGTKQSTIQFQIPEKWNIASSWATVSGQKNTYKAESWISLVNNAIVIGDYAHRTISAKSMNIILAIDQQLNHHTEMFERVFHLQLENYTNIFGQNKDATYLVTIRQSDEDDGVTFLETFTIDQNFRLNFKDEMGILIDLIYELDVLISMALAVNKYGFSFPEFISDETKAIIDVRGLWHPFVKDPQVNDLKFNNEDYFMFLTGPNMAGKTTYLKAVGIAVYTAHLGYGVPAEEMKLTPFNNIFSSINTSDNLSKGYSYFYSEVLRVKEAAKRLRKYNKSLMIFDELFRGTNVKDAYDGSLLVIKGLMQWQQSVFILSSHLIELAKEVTEMKNIKFNYFESGIDNNNPFFTYKILEGISDERLGLLILKNAGIEELLNPKS